MIGCPDWQRLLEHRFDPQVEEPDDWQESLAHLDACEDCRAEAYSQDPTLAFLDLPPVEVSAAEVERMKEAVTTLRHGLAIAGKDSSLNGTGAGQRYAWGRLAAAVVVTIGLGGAYLGGLLPATPSGEAGTASGAEVLSGLSEPPVRPDPSGEGSEELLDGAESPIMPSFPSEPEPAAIAVGWQQAPIVEEIGSPDARVYSYPQEETMALIMVIDPEIEV